MLTNQPNRTLAIYTVEREISEEDNPNDRWHHTSLMLVDETDGEQKILQQLHYFNDQRGKLDAEVREGSYNEERMRGVKAHQITSGNEAEILNLWNVGLWHAMDLKDSGVDWDMNHYKDDPESVNCRKAIKSTLTAMGVEYSDAQYAEVAGTQGDDISLTNAFESRRGWPVGQAGKLWIENFSIVHSGLEVKAYNYGHESRYTGPLPYDLEPMPGVAKGP